MKQLERLIEATILASRWVLVVFYLGLAAALVVYAAAFGKKLFKLLDEVLQLGDAESVLSMLALIDAALVASLIVMVMISGYENFVSRFDEHKSELNWLGKIDAGSLKIKVASTIVAISSIHLLQVFLNVPQYTNNQIMWYTLLHLTFIVSALFLALIDRISKKPGKSKEADL